MHNIIMTTILATAAVGETGAVSDIIAQGQNLGNMSAAAILGVVSLTAVIGLIFLYKDKSKDDAELKTIIASSTAAITKNSELLDKLNITVSSCNKK